MEGTTVFEPLTVLQYGAASALGSLDTVLKQTVWMDGAAATSHTEFGL
jgi:hypothetical protein